MFKPISSVKLWGILALLALASSACSAAPQTAAASGPTAATQPQPVQPSPQPTPTAAPPGLYRAAPLPQSLTEDFPLPPGWQFTDQAETARYRLQIGAGDPPAGYWTLALTAPFATVDDEVAAEDLKSFWLGQQPAPELPFSRLALPSDAQAVLTQWWGSPDPGRVIQRSLDELSTSAPVPSQEWAILPFEQLSPAWKVIAVAGQSPVQKAFDPAQYPLSIPLQLVPVGSAAPLSKGDLTVLQPSLSNRDPKKMTTVILTGVTALVRATAGLMELKGMTYPGEDIRGWLREADITHINNEIPFTPKCPPPYPRENTLVFCSKTKYFELLQDVGADIIELSGDHFQDWGDEAMLFTADFYDQNGLKYYGGGRNLAEASRPLLIEDHGNRLAFLGCNAKAPGYSSAAENRPGAVRCDWPVLFQQIADVRAQGYIPIVTFQHEEYYTYEANPFVIPDFEGTAAAGAAIVSGSQAHQPQALQFHEGALIHYGLGNLFFDQYDEGIPTRQAFIDRHIFYQGRHISTELLTIQFIDNARPRPMTPEERRGLLETVFKASGW